VSVLVRYNPPSLTREQYDQVGQKLTEQGDPNDPGGMEYHVLFGEEGNLKISEIWSSEEQWRAAWENAIKPTVASFGGDPGPDPEIIPVHNIIQP
jgi:hypothetical protein